MREAAALTETFGATRFAQDQVDESQFAAAVDVSEFAPGDELVLLVSVIADPDWGELPTSSQRISPPNVLPQSHMANARTNPDWYFESSASGNVVQGRLLWFSRPLTVQITAPGTDTVTATTRNLKCGPVFVTPSDPGDSSASRPRLSARGWVAVFEVSIALLLFVQVMI